jgi:hypothetical protein
MRSAVLVLIVLMALGAAVSPLVAQTKAPRPRAGATPRRHPGHPSKSRDKRRPARTPPSSTRTGWMPSRRKGS